MVLLCHSTPLAEPRQTYLCHSELLGHEFQLSSHQAFKNVPAALPTRLSRTALNRLSKASRKPFAMRSTIWQPRLQAPGCRKLPHIRTCDEDARFPFSKDLLQSATMRLWTINFHPLHRQCKENRRALRAYIPATAKSNSRNRARCCTSISIWLGAYSCVWNRRAGSMRF